MKVRRELDTIDENFMCGHCEVLFDDCVVADDAVLGEVGEGYRYAQLRLGPGRLSHCMRWLGLARRAQDIALRYASRRHLFGSRLGDLGMAQGMIADSEIDIAAARSPILDLTSTRPNSSHVKSSYAVPRLTKKRHE